MPCRKEAERALYEIVTHDDAPALDNKRLGANILTREEHGNAVDGEIRTKWRIGARPIEDLGQRDIRLDKLTEMGKDVCLLGIGKRAVETWRIHGRIVFLTKAKINSKFTYFKRRRIKMRAVIQRVSRASVVADGKQAGSIGRGLMVLLGVETADGPEVNMEEVDWLARKIAQMRIFADEAGLTNLAVSDVGGDILVVSQFTLFAKTKKGNRPSFIDAARPEVAIPYYEAFVAKLGEVTGREIPTGVFGADMKIDMEADGPVTIIIDTRDKQ